MSVPALPELKRCFYWSLDCKQIKTMLLYFHILCNYYDYSEEKTTFTEILNDFVVLVVEGIKK